MQEVNPQDMVFMQGTAAPTAAVTEVGEGRWAAVREGANGTVTSITQDNPEGRKWTWQEGEYTVIRGNARTAPGCHDNCGVLMYVKDGKLEKIEGDPENPYNHGRLCLRCLAVQEMVDHPDRIVYPMKRDPKDRGKNTWERITWDEAYDLIAERFHAISEEYGPEALWVTQGTGRDINGYSVMMAQFFNTPNSGMGFLSGQGCYAPRLFSTSLKSGGLFVCDYSQFTVDRYDDPRWEPPGYILVWGNNPVVANSDGTLGQWIVECMKRGSRVIAIDPKLTWIAAKADYWLQVRPGTDAALALALCNVIVNEDLYDHDFVEKWTFGYEEFFEHVQAYTPAFAAETCGIDEDLIVETARAIAGASSTCLQWGVAMDHQSEGLLVGMACFDLLALTGNFEKPGSMVAAESPFGVSHPWAPSVDPSMGTCPEVSPEKCMNSKYPPLQAMRAISQDMMLDALETGEPYPIKGMWIQQNNPIANMGAQPQRILPALQKTDFNVVVDLYMTPTALACADVFLPAASFSERIGICGHQAYYLGAIVKAVEPRGEARSDQRIIYEMGQRYRGEELVPWKSEEEFYDHLLQNTGFTYEDLRERTWAYPEFEYYKHEKGLLRPDGQPGFNTPHGRYAFWSHAMAHFGLSPLATFEEPPESPVSTPELMKDYPLVLTTGARRWGFFHSEHRQSPSMRRIHPEPTVMIHPETAEKYGIKDGDWVRIWNMYGECRQKADLSTRIRKDVVSADHGWWFPERDPEDGTLFGTLECNVNQLLPMRPGKSGLGNSYKSMICAIEKYESKGE